MAIKDFNCLYVNGDSWVYGSELIDPARSGITDHFHHVHEAYRKENYWPRHLANSLVVDLVDGSLPGAGNDRILRTTIHDLSKLISEGKRPIAVIAWSQLHRREFSNRGHDSFVSFVNPNDDTTPDFVKEMWCQWNSDYCDLINWLVQIISLHNFCKVNNIPLLGCSVFKKPYNILDQHIKSADIKPYMEQLHLQCSLQNQLYHFSFEAMLEQNPTIKYGLGGHPLEKGHKVLASILGTHIRQKIISNLPPT